MLNLEFISSLSSRPPVQKGWGVDTGSFFQCAIAFAVCLYRDKGPLFAAQRGEEQGKKREDLKLLSRFQSADVQIPQPPTPVVLSPVCRRRLEDPSDAAQKTEERDGVR